VLLRDHCLGRVPVAVAGDQPDERLAQRELLRGVGQETPRRPEVGVRVLVVVVEEVEEAEVALEGAAIGRVVAGKGIGFGRAARIASTARAPRKPARQAR